MDATGVTRMEHCLCWRANTGSSAKLVNNVQYLKYVLALLRCMNSVICIWRIESVRECILVIMANIERIFICIMNMTRCCLNAIFVVLYTWCINIKWRTKYRSVENGCCIFKVEHSYLNTNILIRFSESGMLQKQNVGWLVARVAQAFCEMTANSVPNIVTCSS